MHLGWLGGVRLFALVLAVGIAPPTSSVRCVPWRACSQEIQKVLHDG